MSSTSKPGDFRSVQQGSMSWFSFTAPIGSDLKNSIGTYGCGPCLGMRIRAPKKHTDGSTEDGCFVAHFDADIHGIRYKKDSPAAADVVKQTTTMIKLLLSSNPGCSADIKSFKFVGMQDGGGFAYAAFPLELIANICKVLDPDFVMPTTSKDVKGLYDADMNDVIMPVGDDGKLGPKLVLDFNQKHWTAPDKDRELVGPLPCTWKPYVPKGEDEKGTASSAAGNET